MNLARAHLLLASTVFTLAGVALAQAPKAGTEPNAQAKADGKTPFNPLGDPKKFTRMGGWGGIGGAMGQMGFGQSMLIMNPAVQKELRLSEDQKKALKEWSEDMREKGQTMFRRPERGQDQGGDGQANPEGEQPARPGIAEMFTMMNRVSEFLRENESGFQRILTKDQRKRLAQLTLQMEGLPGVIKPEVATLLNLSDDQILNIQQILADLRTRQMGLWMQQAISMQAERSNWTRNRAQAETPPQTDRKPPAREKADSQKAQTPATQATPSKPPEDEQARRAEMTKRFRQRFETMREGTDQLQELAVNKIYRQLTKRQRGVFDKLLGDPFDVDKMVKEGGFGPRRPGQETPNEPAAKPETDAIKRTQTPEASRKSTRLRDLRKGTAQPDSPTRPDSQ